MQFFLKQVWSIVCSENLQSELRHLTVQMPVENSCLQTDTNKKKQTERQAGTLCMQFFLEQVRSIVCSENLHSELRDLTVQMPVENSCLQRDTNKTKQTERQAGTLCNACSSFWNRYEAFYVLKTFAVRPGISLCRCLLRIVVYRQTHRQIETQRQTEIQTHRQSDS